MTKKFFTQNKTLLLILILAFLLRSFELTEVFAGHHEMMGAKAGVISRNHLKYGFLETKFGAITNVIDGEFIYYSNHPQLGAIIRSVSCMVFGLDEWSLRLPYVLFGVINILLLYLIVKRMWGHEIGLYSALFLAFIPETAYFDRVPWSFPMMFFFIYLLLYSYVNWFQTKNKKFLYLAVISTFLGGLTAHYIFPLVGLLFLHNLLFREKIGVKFMLLIPIVAAAAFLVNLIHSSYLGGTISHLSSEGGKYLDFKLLLNRSFYRLFMQRFLQQIGFIILILSTIWIWDMLKKKLNFGDTQELFKNTLVFLLLFYGIMWFILMPGATYEHDYFIYMLLPALTISSSKALKLLPKNVYAPIVLLFLFFSIYNLFGMHANSSYHEELIVVSKYLNKVSSDGELVLATTYEREGFIGYYSQRSVVSAVDEAGFQDSFVTYKPDIVLISDEEFDSVLSVTEMLKSKGYRQLDDRGIPPGFYVWRK